MKDVTLLIAHADDENLFCWPVLDRVKRIICASNDSENPERAWCKERGKCLDEVGELLGADVIQLPYNSEFYRLPTRDGSLKCAAVTIMGHLRGAETIFTHNAWGEYGHLDHILCHHIGRTVQAETGCELLTTDIAVTGHPAWLPIKTWVQCGPTGPAIIPFSLPPENEWEAYSADHKIDRPLFDRIKGIYDARGCWTWAWEPVEECKVYSL